MCSASTKSRRSSSDRQRAALAYNGPRERASKTVRLGKEDAEGTSMRHFVQYHNTEKMRGPPRPAAGEPYRIVTSKPVGELTGNTVWLIAGEGKPRTYTLCYRFVVDRVGDAEEGGFRHFASGTEGRTFDAIPVNGLPPGGPRFGTVAVCSVVIALAVQAGGTYLQKTQARLGLPRANRLYSLNSAVVDTCPSVPDALYNARLEGHSTEATTVARWGLFCVRGGRLREDERNGQWITESARLSGCHGNDARLGWLTASVPGSGGSVWFTDACLAAGRRESGPAAWRWRVRRRLLHESVRAAPR